MARIVEHLPIEELEARYRAARDVTEARHYQAIWLLAQGRTVLEVAEVGNRKFDSAGQRARTGFLQDRP